MSLENIRLVKETWGLVASKGLDITISFYDKLFEIAPGVRSMFKKDVDSQAEKLLFTLGFVVTNLDRLDEIRIAIEQLGKLHKNAYKVKDEHYAFVVEALIWALSNSLDEMWTDEHEKAWIWAMSTVGGIMVEASNTN